MRRKLEERVGDEAEALSLSAGLAHRDLKPDNFMFASTEPTAALKLIDFGCSLSALEAPATNYMHMAGTLEHTAPYRTHALPDRP